MTDPDDVEPDVYVETAPADADAAAVFGQDWVDAAISGLTEFVVAEAFPEALLDPAKQDFTQDELAPDVVLERFTPEAAAAWLAFVDGALAGDPEAADAVRSFRYYGVDAPWTIRDDEPVVTSQQITDVEIGVDPTGGTGQETLLVSFDHDATLGYLDEDGDDVALDVEKSMTYLLTPVAEEGGPQWLIAGFDGDFESSVS